MAWWTCLYTEQASATASNQVMYFWFLSSPAEMHSTKPHQVPGNLQRRPLDTQHNTSHYLCFWRMKGLPPRNYHVHHSRRNYTTISHIYTTAEHRYNKSATTRNLLIPRKFFGQSQHASSEHKSGLRTSSSTAAPYYCWANQNTTSIWRSSGLYKNALHCGIGQQCMAEFTFTNSDNTYSRRGDWPRWWGR